MSDASPIDLTKLRIDRADDRPAPRRRRARGFPLTSLLVLLGLGGLGWILWPRIEPMVARWRAPEVRAGIVIITRPGADLELTTASGYVVPRTKAALAAKVAGTLTELLVDVGDAVADKQLIAQIERVDWENRKAQQEAELKRAQAAAALAAHRIVQARGVVARIEAEESELASALAESAATLKEAERVLERDQNLLASGAGIRDDVDRATNELARARAATSRVAQSRSVLQARKAEAALAVTEAEFIQKQAAVGVTRALADLAVAETDLLHTEIRAPFAGTILRKEAEVGEIVVPALAGGSTSRGAVVTELSNNRQSP
ncbi:MAG TPA: biotin/lipoyl-binding protein [Planctomycetota bacterium]|nr:biotin/lipoyl-binding protein [Planctomycetota bacterium]